MIIKPWQPPPAHVWGHRVSNLPPQVRETELQGRELTDGAVGASTKVKAQAPGSSGRTVGYRRDSSQNWSFLPQQWTHLVLRPTWAVPSDCWGGLRGEGGSTDLSGATLSLPHHPAPLHHPAPPLYWVDAGHCAVPSVSPVWTDQSGLTCLLDPHALGRQGGDRATCLLCPPQ